MTDIELDREAIKFIATKMNLTEDFVKECVKFHERKKSCNNSLAGAVNFFGNMYDAYIAGAKANGFVFPPVNAKEFSGHTSPKDNILDGVEK